MAIDYSAAVNQRAGIGRLTRGLFGALFELDHASRYKLLYAATAATDLAALPRQDNVEPLRLPLGERWQTIVWNRLRLPLWADTLAGGAAVFHAPNFVLPPVRRARTVLTVHDLTFEVRPECAEPSLRRYLCRAVPASIARANRVVVDSQATADDVMRLYGTGATKIEVLQSAADARFRPLPRDVAEAVVAGRNVPRPFLLAVGTLEPRKNLARLVDAIAALDGQHHLVVVGARGWLYSDLLEKLRHPKVHLAEGVSDEELVALYNLADAVICPSLYEGFGLPALEAMACGTPVAVSDVSSLPEVVGQAGLLFDPLDTSSIAAAVHRLSSDAALRTELGQAGLARAQTFDWATSARKLKAIYLDLMR